MATIELTIPTLNFSIQVGDIAYYTNLTTSGGFDIPATPSNNTEGSFFGTGSQTPVVRIGEITDILATGIECEIDSSTALPTAGSFIFFSKDNTVNTTSLLGYYGEVEFRNDSTEKAELFATACEVVESSK